MFYLGVIFLTMKPFCIRAYAKQELAMCYFPSSITSHAAVNHLMGWIKRCKILHQHLIDIGYHKHAKCFSAKEVELIVKFLGEP